MKLFLGNEVLEMFKFTCLSLSVLVSMGGAHAQETGLASNLFYFGGGSADTTDPLKNDDTPFVIGFMHQPAGKSVVFGFDLAGEGTSIDSTYRQNKNLAQAISYNFLIGTNVVTTGRFKADVALLVGLRQAAADCPDSYLGYACYADTSPVIEYAGNIGAVVTMSFNNIAVGFRATDQSAQVLLGLRF